MICDGCGEEIKTLIPAIAEELQVDEVRVHELIYDGDIQLSGCHAIRALQ